MYNITLTMQNPHAPSVAAVDLKFQTDPAGMTPAKWANAYPTMKAALDQLVVDSTPKEPTVW